MLKHQHVEYTAVQPENIRLVKKAGDLKAGENPEEVLNTDLHPSITVRKHKQQHNFVLSSRVDSAG